MTYCVFSKKKKIIGQISFFLFFFFEEASQNFRKTNKIHLRRNKTCFPAKLVLYTKEHLLFMFELGPFSFITWHYQIRSDQSLSCV